jgi:putative transposase
MTQGLRSPGGLQRFISIFSELRHLFVPPSSKLSTLTIHIHRLKAMAEWKAVAGMRA